MNKDDFAMSDGMSAVLSTCIMVMSKHLNCDAETLANEIQEAVNESLSRLDDTSGFDSAFKVGGERMLSAICEGIIKNESGELPPAIGFSIRD